MDRGVALGFSGFDSLTSYSSCSIRSRWARFIEEGLG